MKNSLLEYTHLTQCCSKKQVLRSLANFLAQTSSERSDVIFENLLEREQVADTALEKGVALPHFVHEKNKEARILVATLEKSIPDWSCLDGSKVSLLICLVLPKEYTKQTPGIDQVIMVMKYLADSDLIASLIDRPAIEIADKLTKCLIEDRKELRG